MDVGDLLLAIGRDLPRDKKGGAGKQRKAAEKRPYCPPPGMVRLNGSFLWAGKSRENGTV
jgi:hypothetical protein